MPGYWRIEPGGKTADWGAEFTQLDNVKRAAPDILIIAFGMNDGVSGTDNTGAFYQNTKTIIDNAKSKNPDCAVVLVGAMLPNAAVGYGQGVSMLQQHKKYPAVLKDLASGYSGVVVADITAMHEHILKVKSFQDVSTNNINHPNDYIHRLYAQVILRIMGVI